MHSSAGSATNNEAQTTNKFVASILSEYSVLLLTFVLLVCVAPFASSLISGATALNITSALLPLFVAAIGLTVVMIAGGIDLSIPAIIALTSIAGAKLM